MNNNIDWLAKHSNKRAYLFTVIALLYGLECLGFIFQEFYSYQWRTAIGVTFEMFIGHYSGFIGKVILEQVIFFVITFNKWKWVSFVLPFQLEHFYYEGTGIIETSWEQHLPMFQAGKFIAVIDLALVACISINTLFLVWDVIKWVHSGEKMQ